MTAPTRCLSVAQVAELLACSEDHVTDLLRAGEMVGVKVGARRWAVTEGDYEAFIERRRHEVAS